MGQGGNMPGNWLVGGCRRTLKTTARDLRNPTPDALQSAQHGTVTGQITSRRPRNALAARRRRFRDIGKLLSAGKFSGNFRCSDVAREVTFYPAIPPCIAREFGRKFCKALSRNSGRGLGGFAARYAPIPCASGGGLASLNARPWPLVLRHCRGGADFSLIQPISAHNRT